MYSSREDFVVVVEEEDEEDDGYNERSKLGGCSCLRQGSVLSF